MAARKAKKAKRASSRVVSKKFDPSKYWAHISGGVFLIGLGILFLTGTFWPGILFLVGISAIAGGLLKKEEK